MEACALRAFHTSTSVAVLLSLWMLWVFAFLFPLYWPIHTRLITVRIRIISYTLTHAYTALRYAYVLCICGMANTIGGMVFGCKIPADRSYLRPGWVGPLNTARIAPFKLLNIWGGSPESSKTPFLFRTKNNYKQKITKKNKNKEIIELVKFLCFLRCSMWK